MPTTARIAPEGMVFHVLNRGVGRMWLFNKPADYEAFERIIEKTLESRPKRICAECRPPWGIVSLLTCVVVGLALLYSALPSDGVKHTAIQDIQLGERVLGENPEPAEASLPIVEPDPATWRRVDLRATKDDGTHADISLLRPSVWVSQNEARVGHKVHISVPECGIDGHATVLAIGPCPSIDSGPGHVVTGTFRHSSARVVDGTEIPWSDRALGLLARQLERGTTDSIKVKNRSQAEEIFLRLYGGKGYRNTTTGFGVDSPSLIGTKADYSHYFTQQGRMADIKNYLGSSRKTYHWDVDFDPATGLIRGHNALHGATPHLQIHDEFGRTIRINWDP